MAPEHRSRGDRLESIILFREEDTDPAMELWPGLSILEYSDGLFPRQASHLLQEKYQAGGH